MNISDTIPTTEDFRTEFKRDVKSSDLERKVVAFLNSPDGGKKKGGIKKGGPKTEKGGLKTPEDIEDERSETSNGGLKKGGLKTEKGGIKKGGPKAEKGGIKKGGPKREDYLNQGVHVRIRIAELLANGEATTTAQLIERLGKARSTVFKHLALLRRMNVIRYVGSSKNGHWEVRPGGVE